MAPDLSKLFGEQSAARQLLVWGVLAQVLAAVLGPEMQLLQREVSKLLQATPLSAEQLADMVVRNIVPEGAASEYAKESGIAPGDFRRLLGLAGEAPGPQQLVEALRRGIIEREGTGPEAISFQQGIAETRLYNKWRPVLERLGMVPIPPADAVDAVVESQISFEEGQRIAFLSGVSAEDFRILFNTRGNPPSPGELQDLVRRGIVPMKGLGPDVTSLEQGIAEGATKNKWTFAFEALTETIPPPRTVTALLRNGTIGDEQALGWFKMAGLSQEAATAYVHDAHHQKLQATKDLAAADIEQLYFDQIVSREDAARMLVELRYTAEEAAFKLDIVDFRRILAALNQAIGRVHSVYVAHKITQQQAVTALDALHVPPAQRDQLLATWSIERTSNVKVLSQAEIANAFFYGIIEQSEAMDELTAQGWTPRDAWILLSVRKHTPLPNPPEQGLAG